MRAKRILYWVTISLLIAIIVLGAALVITPIALLVSSLMPLQVAEEIASVNG